MKKTSALWLSVVLAASLLFSSCAKQGGQTASPAETTGAATAESKPGKTGAETTSATNAENAVQTAVNSVSTAEESQEGAKTSGITAPVQTGDSTPRKALAASLAGLLSGAYILFYSMKRKHRDM